jgi:trehalose 2-sulfotransferase
MLHGIETGYEGKFDFPSRFVPPERSFMLASVPRTGSTYLSHLLWQTGCLGAPLEYLNFDPAGPYFFAATSTENQDWLWQSVVRRRTSPNGVFGVKCFPSQLQILQEANPQLLQQVLALLTTGTGGGAKVVLLNRRDRDAHAISYARAILSGVWRKEQEASGRTEVEFSKIAVDRARNTLDAQEAAWGEMFTELRIDPLVLEYEDVVADPEAAVRAVASYVGVVPAPGARIEIPRVERQAEADSRAWAERYAATKSRSSPC